MDENLENRAPVNKNPWNKRQQKSPLALYLLLALLCLTFAYLLSGTAR